MTVARSEAASGRRWRPRPGTGRRAAVLAALVVLTRLPGMVARRVFNTDEATLGLGGRALADGGHLYVDLIDRKPPLPFAIYAALGTADLRPVRMFVAVLILLAGLLVADEAERRWGTVAGWTAGLVLVLGASALGAQDAQAANFELFALLPIVVAVVGAARGRPIVAGVALAVAVLCKQPAAVTVVPVALGWWRSGRWRHVALGSGATALTGIGLAAPFGIGRVLEWALLGTGGYLGFGLADLGEAALRLAALAVLAVGFWGGAWLLAAPARRPRAGESSAPPADGDGGAGRAIRRRLERPDLDVEVLLAVSLVALLPGLRLFPHYLLQLLPALALLAGRGAAALAPRRRSALAWAVASSVVAAGLAWSMALGSPPAVQVAVARAVRGFSEPGDPVLVWGNEPEISWLADRPPAGGYPHSEFFTGHSGGRRDRVASEADLRGEDLARYRRWVAGLRADPPVVVVDTAAGELRGGEWFRLDGFPALAHLVAADYDRVATIEGVDVYRLREDP